MALIGSILPRHYDFTCSVEIEAAPEQIFDEVNPLSNWQSWSNWNSELVSDLEISGQAGIGNTMTWSDPRGSGKIWIVESQRPQRVEYRQRFGNFPESTGVISIEPSTVELSDVERGKYRTTVHWRNIGRLPGGPFYGFMAPFFPSNMEVEYQKFLDRLKSKLETVH